MKRKTKVVHKYKPIPQLQPLMRESVCFYYGHEFCRDCLNQRICKVFELVGKVKFLEIKGCRYKHTK